MNADYRYLDLYNKMIKILKNCLEINEALNNYREEYVTTKDKSYLILIFRIFSGDHPKNKRVNMYAELMKNRDHANLICKIIEQFGEVLTSASGPVCSYDPNNEKGLTFSEYIDIILRKKVTSMQYQNETNESIDIPQSDKLLLTHVIRIVSDMGINESIYNLNSSKLKLICERLKSDYSKYDYKTMNEIKLKRRLMDIYSVKYFVEIDKYYEDDEGEMQQLEIEDKTDTDQYDELNEYSIDDIFDSEAKESDIEIAYTYFLYNLIKQHINDNIASNKCSKKDAFLNSEKYFLSMCKTEQNIQMLNKIKETIIEQNSLLSIKHLLHFFGVQQQSQINRALDNIKKAYKRTH